MARQQTPNQQIGTLLGTLLQYQSTMMQCVMAQNFILQNLASIAAPRTIVQQPLAGIAPGIGLQNWGQWGQGQGMAPAPLFGAGLNGGGKLVRAVRRARSGSRRRTAQQPGAGATVVPLTRTQRAAAGNKPRRRARSRRRTTQPTIVPQQT